MRGNFFRREVLINNPFSPPLSPPRSLGASRAFIQLLQLKRKQKHVQIYHVYSQTAVEKSSYSVINHDGTQAWDPRTVRALGRKQLFVFMYFFLIWILALIIF